MDYLSEYYSIIKSRLNNILLDKEYGENHHITPRSFFMCNEANDVINHKDNIVRLTHEEHFLTHYYLWKHYESNFRHTTFYYKALMGFNAMGIMDKINDDTLYYYSKLYSDGRETLREFNKEKMIPNIISICEFKKEFGCNPKSHSDNKKESYLGRLLIGLKSAKADNNNHYAFYDEYQEIANSYGLNDLFEYIDYKQIGINKVIDICDFVVKNGFTPRKSSIDNYERLLSITLINLKCNNTNSTVFYDEYQEIANSYGLNDLFKKYDKEEYNLNIFKEICIFIEENKRLPKITKKNEKEMKLGYKLSELKRRFKNKKLYNNIKDYLIEYSYDNYFKNWNWK